MDKDFNDININESDFFSQNENSTEINTESNSSESSEHSEDTQKLRRINKNRRRNQRKKEQRKANKKEKEENATTPSIEELMALDQETMERNKKEAAQKAAITRQKNKEESEQENTMNNNDNLTEAEAVDDIVSEEETSIDDLLMSDMVIGEEDYEESDDYSNDDYSQEVPDVIGLNAEELLAELENIESVNDDFDNDIQEEPQIDISNIEPNIDVNSNNDENNDNNINNNSTDAPLETIVNNDTNTQDDSNIGNEKCINNNNEDTASSDGTSDAEEVIEIESKNINQNDVAYAEELQDTQIVQKSHPTSSAQKNTNKYKKKFAEYWKNTLKDYVIKSVVFFAAVVVLFEIPYIVAVLSKDKNSNKIQQTTTKETTTTNKYEGIIKNDKGLQEYIEKHYGTTEHSETENTTTSQEKTTTYEIESTTKPEEQPTTTVPVIEDNTTEPLIIPSIELEGMSDRFASLDDLCLYLESTSATIHSSQVTSFNKYLSGSISQRTEKKNITKYTEGLNELLHLLVVNKSNFYTKNQMNRYYDIENTVTKAMIYSDVSYYLISTDKDLEEAKVIIEKYK